MDNLLLHIIIFLSILPLFAVKYRRNQLNALLTILGAIGAALVTGLAITDAAAIAIGAAVVIGAVGAVGATIYGGVALSSTMGKSSLDYGMSSPTYSAQKQTQTNPDLPIPLLYGTVKVAGNRIWQEDNHHTRVRRIVGFSDGEIEDFTDIRLNDIEVSKISGIKIQKFYGTSGQGLPTGLPSGIGLDQLGSLKYLAYLYIDVPKTSKIDINYNLTTVVKGRKIRVYQTPTNYSYQYSENPAWVMFDFLTSYNGRGLCLKDDGTLDDDEVEKLFDLQSFIESASYCNELITYVDNDGQTKTTPRFTFNMVFDSQTSHKTLLDEIQRSCRGGLFTKEGKLQFKIDKAEVVSKVFNESDILDGSETFQTLPNEENYEVLKIDYVSPAHEWQKVQAYAEIPLTRTGVPIEHNINCYSVTNFQQASRLAWYYLNSKRLCPYFGSFKTGFKAWDLEVGQVIEIPVILMGLQNYKVKVTSVINNGTGTYTVNYRTYDARLYNDDLGCKEPTVLVTNINDLYSFPDDVTNFNVTQNQNLYEFVWDYNSNPSDVYEIRHGETWASGTIIGKNISENRFSYAIQTKGLHKFWIKAFNGYNYSENATGDIIQINDIPNMNEIISLNILDMNMATASFHYTKIYKQYTFETVDNQLIPVAHNTLKIEVGTREGIVTPIKWLTTDDKWGEGNMYYQNGGFWGAIVRDTARFVSPISDLGQVYTSYVSADVGFQSPDDANSCTIFFKTSEDNIEWTNWRTLITGNYTFRYIQIRVVFNIENSVQSVIDKLNVVIDVPDKILNMEAEITDANEGVVVEYEFNTLPSIVATVNDSITAYAVVESKTKNNAKIYIYDNDGNLTTGKLSLVLKGY